MGTGEWCLGKKIFSQWSHHHTGLWLGSKAQDMSGVSHLRSDLIPGKRLWAPSYVQDFQDHAPTSSVFWDVQWLCQCVLWSFCTALGSLFSWLLLDIVYFPKETHKVRNRTCSHGSVASTLSKWQVWEFCDPVWVFKNRRGARLLDKFLVMENTFLPIHCMSW